MKRWIGEEYYCWYGKRVAYIVTLNDIRPSKRVFEEFGIKLIIRTIEYLLSKGASLILVLEKSCIISKVQKREQDIFFQRFFYCLGRVFGYRQSGKWLIEEVISINRLMPGRLLVINTFRNDLKFIFSKTQIDVFVFEDWATYKLIRSSSNFQKYFFGFLHYSKSKFFLLNFRKEKTISLIGAGCDLKKKQILKNLLESKVLLTSANWLTCIKRVDQENEYRQRILISIGDYEFIYSVWQKILEFPVLVFSPCDFVKVQEIMTNALISIVGKAPSNLSAVVEIGPRTIISYREIVREFQYILWHDRLYKFKENFISLHCDVFSIIFKNKSVYPVYSFNEKVK
ncbi:MAG: hypothetical protein HYS16_00635 [Deltaproteobacteria bacterium]|nr:MAG: hypothetical protein HYS16_00635 [Deltaproteobacteria bacterium]